MFEKMKSKVKELRGNDLLIAFFVLFVISVISIVISAKFDRYNFFMNFYDSGHDRFMDFFNSCRDVSITTVYTVRQVIYPPLANMIYAVMNYFISKDYLGTSFLERYQAYTNSSAMITFMIYSTLTTVMLSLVVFQNKRGSVFEKLFFTIFMMLSQPFLYGFERGNIVVVAVILLTFFAFNYDSDNKVVRELALISLAIAAAIKIYPVFAGLLLLRKGMYKESVRAIIYGVLLFFGPFYFFDGINGFGAFVNNLLNFDKAQIKTSIYAVSSLRLLITKVHFMTGFSWININFIFFTTFILGVISIFITNSEWKRWGLIFALISNSSGAGGHYIWMFSILPYMMMLNQKKVKRTDLVYFVLYTSMLIYYPYLNKSIYTINGLMLCIVSSLMFLMLIADALFPIVKKLIDHRNKLNDQPSLD